MASPSLRCVAAALAMTAALGSCGADHRGNGAAAGDNGTPAKIDLTSDAFRSGQAIPSRYSCDGGNRTPLLKWDDPGVGAKSFALVVDDPDAPSGPFRHWGVFDIPASARSIGGDQRVGTEVTNDFGKPGYDGPCPPNGHGPHHYHFKLFALDTNRLGLSSTDKIADLEKAARQHAIAEGELVGTYERK